MSCILAMDPDLSIGSVVMLDSNVPVLDQRRQTSLDQMIPWVDRAAEAGRLITQAGWIAEASSWVPDFFSLEDQGDSRLRIERRFMFAPVVEAGAGDRRRRPVADLQSRGIHHMPGVRACGRGRPNARRRTARDPS